MKPTKDNSGGLTTGQKLLIQTLAFVIVAGLLLLFLFWKQGRDEQKAAEQEAYEASVEAAYKEALPTAAPALTEEDIEELFDSYRPNVETVPTTGPDATVEPTVTPFVCPIDFESLWKLNKDVYAWISVPGTVIEYPVLQHATDHSYYLNYNIDGSHGYPGCIYTENLNSKDFTDNNTILYGHNMKNGTMFAGLHKFEDSSFFEEHEEVLIYTPKALYRYIIFATYVYDDRHLMYSFDFANEDVYATYLENIFQIRDLNAHFREGVTVTGEDKIVTLSTCIKNMPENRLLVQAVLDEVVYYEE